MTLDPTHPLEYETLKRTNPNIQFLKMFSPVIIRLTLTWTKSNPCTNLQRILLLWHSRWCQSLANPAACNKTTTGCSLSDYSASFFWSLIQALNYYVYTLHPTVRHTYCKTKDSRLRRHFPKSSESLPLPLTVSCQSTFDHLWPLYPCNNPWADFIWAWHHIGLGSIQSWLCYSMTLDKS